VHAQYTDRRCDHWLDPHPITHTAAAFDESGKVLESLTISKSMRVLQRLEHLRPLTFDEWVEKLGWEAKKNLRKVESALDGRISEGNLKKVWHLLGAAYSTMSMMIVVKSAGYYALY
jgi:hypothetical protein